MKLTTDELFSAGTEEDVAPTPSGKMTTEQLFGGAQQAPVSSGKPASGFSTRELFGTELDPEQGGYPAVTKKDAGLGVMGWGKELARAAAGGFAGSFGSYLQGKAGDTGKPIMLPGESDIGYQMRLDEWRSQPPELPVAQNPLYRAGEAIQEAPIFQRPKGMHDSLALDVAGGAGSLGAMLATAPLGPAVGIEFATGMGRGEGVQRAVKAGATEEQIRRAGELANAAGVTDLADLLLLGGGPGKALGLFGKIATGAGIEGLQEGAQQLIQNWISKQIYKPDQDLSEEVLRNVIVGAIVGGAAKPLLDRGGKREEAPTSEDIQAVFGGELPPSDLPPDGAPSGAPTDVSSRIRVGQPPPAEPLSPIETLLQTPADGAPPGTQGTVSLEQGSWTYRDQISDEEAMGLLWDWAENPEGAPRLHGLKLTPSTIDFKAATLPQWIDLAKQRLAAAAEPSPTAPPPEMIPPEPEKPKPNEIPSNVINFLERKQPKIRVPEQSDPNAPMLEEITGQPGADLGRIAKILGPQLYDISELPKVTIKEIVQNSFDAIKGMIEAGTLEEGNIAINVDENARTVTVADNGSGMTPEILATKFLEIAGTQKEGERASGGFGIAKMAFLFGNKTLDVRTMRDGKVAHLTATGPQLFAAMTDPSQRPKIQVRAPTAAELKLFKDGHGTAIQVSIPEGYTDSEGEQRSIRFPWNENDVEVLKNSPLFNNISVFYNDRPLDGTAGTPAIGKNFPVQDYTPFANVNFKNWGKARIYVSTEPRNDIPTGENAHVLSNGLWQFSFDIGGNAQVNRQFYIDVAPHGRPEDGNYPFELNRQGFTKSARRDFDKIDKYLTALYRHEELSEEAFNYGDVHYLQRNPETGELERVAATITPNKPQTWTPMGFTKQANSVVVTDGQILVNGKEVPELTPSQMRDLQPNVSELKVDQDTVDPKRPMVHDNTIVEISAIEKKPLTQLATEKFGKRFDEYIFTIGEMFSELRDVVAGMTMPNEARGIERRLNATLNRPNTTTRDYSGLKKEVIGISFDPAFRGASVKVPFSGMFINPAAPEYSDPLRSALGIVWTMQHELAHFKVRNHSGDYEAESSRIRIHLDAHPTFDFNEFKQRMVAHVAANQEIHQYINDFFSGAFDLTTRGRSFKDYSTLEGRDGGRSEPRTQALSGTSSPAGIPSGAPAGNRLTPAGQGRGRPYLRITETRPVGPPDRRAEYTAALRAESGDNQLEAPGNTGDYEPMYQAIQTAFKGKTRRGGGPPPPAVLALPAHAARMNKMMAYTHGIERVVEKNLHVEPMVRAGQVVRAERRDAAMIIDTAQTIAKHWRHLGIGKGSQMEALGGLIDDVVNMNYRTPAEVAAGVGRHPTTPEFEALMAKHKVAKPAFEVFKMQTRFFHTFLAQVRQDAITRAARTYYNDPQGLIRKTNEINARFRDIMNRPYFPLTGFGKHFVQVKDQNGIPIFFQRYERRGVQSARSVRDQAEKQIRKQFAKEIASGQYTVNANVLPESAVPFMGLPSELLEGIETQLSSSDPQKLALQMLKIELSPATRFAHRFKGKNYTPGYSHEMLRAFSRFAFHAARYYARTKWNWALSSARVDLNRMALASRDPKLTALVNYLDDFQQYTMADTKGDFGNLKSGIFAWTFLFSAAGATLNLSQMPILVWNFLGVKYGPPGVGYALASKAMLKAIGDLKNTYTGREKIAQKAKEPNAGFEIRALDYAVKTSRITESQAADLAALSKADTLLGLGNSKLARGWQRLLEVGVLPFELAEQMNRRVAFRAALDLAMKYPNSKGVKQAVEKYSDELDQLIKGSWDGSTGPMNPSEARAVVAAIDAVEQTNFVYAKENRPRLMRNRYMALVLVFTNFVFQTMQVLGNNKTMIPGYMLTMMYLTGIMGLPGAEEVEDIVNFIGRRLYGKDWNAQQRIREILTDMGQGELSELVLHGMAKKGFGIPALLDMFGENPSRGLTAPTFVGSDAGGWSSRAGHSNNVPAPVLDRSQALGMGRLLPVNIGKLLDPGKDVDKVLGQEAQRASGAVFSVGFNLAKALYDLNAGADPYDFKTWEKAMPRAMGAATRGWRAYDEHRSRGKGGEFGAQTIIPYDVRDTEQMMEVIAMGLGYTPARETNRWAFLTAVADAEAKAKFEQEILLQQRFEAQMGGGEEEINRAVQAIIDYNEKLPDHLLGYRISADTLQKSMEARARAKAEREAGIPSQLRNRGIMERYKRLFQESITDVREINPVRKNFLRDSKGTEY